MALTLPKLALPTLTLDKKKIPAIVGGVLVLAAAGWFGWQYFEDTAPAPAAKNQPAAAAKQIAPAKAAAPADTGPARDKLIEDLLVASGLKQQLSQLPQKMTAGVGQSSPQHSKTSAALLAAIEKAMAASFTEQNFHDRLSVDLKKDFDQKRMRALLGDFSAPAAKRMIEMEQATPSAQELGQFVRSRAANKLSPARTELIQRIDAATRASELAVEAAFASMKALSLGMVGAQARQAAAIDKAIEKQRVSTTENIRNSTFSNLAFSYRNASDADLEGYAKFCEAENSKWFSGIVYASLLEEIKSAAAQAGERMGALASKPGKSASPAAKPARSKSRADARTCLDLATNPAVIKCAEPYR